MWDGNDYLFRHTTVFGVPPIHGVWGCCFSSSKCIVGVVRNQLGIEMPIVACVMLSDNRAAVPCSESSYVRVRDPRLNTFVVSAIPFPPLWFIMTEELAFQTIRG